MTRPHDPNRLQPPPKSAAAFSADREAPAGGDDPFFEATAASCDPPILREVLLRLRSSIRPVGRVEGLLVEQLAVTYVRMQRCARVETYFHEMTWREPHKRVHAIEFEALLLERKAGMPVKAFRQKYFDDSFEKTSLQGLRLTNQFLRILHEIERHQLRRQGADVPPPAAVDVNLASLSANALAGGEL